MNKRFRGNLYRGAIAILAVLLNGCIASTPPGEAVLGPNGQVGVGPDYSLETIADGTNHKYLIIFAFSGGGKRSAAFGYGALTAAHEIQMPEGNRKLSQEVDIVSGVSGGSFTAAAYAYYREDLFDDAASNGHPRPAYIDFLTSNLTLEMVKIYIDPYHWRWMFDRNVGTNDEMAHNYYKFLFPDFPSEPGPRYAALAAKGRPYLMIQATDLDTQQPFTFTQNDFDLICSDLSNYPLSRAIAASNGFPILFSPIGVQMFTYDTSLPQKYCPLVRWRDNYSADPSVFSHESELRSNALQYAPSQEVPADGSAAYLHLADGGLSDNLALRGPMALWTRIEMERKSGPDPACTGQPGTETTRLCQNLARLDFTSIEHILVVSVDGESELNRKSELNIPVLSGIKRAFTTALNSAINSKNSDTLPGAYDMTQNLADTVTHMKCANLQPEQKCQAVDATFAHVALSDWARQPAGKKPPGQFGREALATEDTGLSLSEADAQTLIAAGHDQFLCAPAIRAFLHNINGQLTDRQSNMWCARPDK